MEKPAAATPRLAYGMEELAEAIGVSRACVYGLKAEGKLTTFKLGRRTLVTADEARRLLTELQAAA